jgi:hypothetical protein
VILGALRESNRDQGELLGFQNGTEGRALRYTRISIPDWLTAVKGKLDKNRISVVKLVRHGSNYGAFDMNVCVVCGLLRRSGSRYACFGRFSGFWTQYGIDGVGFLFREMPSVEQAGEFVRR